MKNKYAFYVIFVPLVVITIIGYPRSITAFIWEWGHPAFISFLYTCTYLISWLLILYVAVNYRSKKIIIVCCGYWLMTFFLSVVLMIPAIMMSQAAILALLASFVFIVPMMGAAYPFATLFGMLGISLPDVTSISIAFVSIGMFAIGLSAKMQMPRMPRGQFS